MWKSFFPRQFHYKGGKQRARSEASIFFWTLNRDVLYTFQLFYTLPCDAFVKFTERKENSLGLSRISDFSSRLSMLWNPYDMTRAISIKY